MKYRVIGEHGATFAAGQELQLSKAQIRAREHRLEKTGSAGRSRAIGPVTFKCGETLTLKDDFDKLPASLKTVLLPETKARKLDGPVGPVGDGDSEDADVDEEDEDTGDGDADGEDTDVDEEDEDTGDGDADGEDTDVDEDTANSDPEDDRHTTMRLATGEP